MGHDLRSEHRRAIIENTFERLKGKKNLTLWQNLEGERTRVSCRIIKVNLAQEYLKLQCHSNNQFNFNSRLPVYGCERLKTLIFKSTIQFQNRFSLELRLPQSFMQKEFRADFRMTPKGKEMLIKFTFPSDNYGRLFQKPMLDYGHGGCSFVTGRYEFQGVGVGERIQLQGDPNSSHPQNVLARINSISPYFDGRMFSKTQLRIGLVYLY